MEELKKKKLTVNVTFVEILNLQARYQEYLKRIPN